MIQWAEKNKEISYLPMLNILFVNPCTNTKCTGRRGEKGVCRADSPGRGYYISGRCIQNVTGFCYISGSCIQNVTGFCYCWSFNGIAVEPEQPVTIGVM